MGTTTILCSSRVTHSLDCACAYACADVCVCVVLSVCVGVRLVCALSNIEGTSVAKVRRINNVRADHRTTTSAEGNLEAMAAVTAAVSEPFFYRQLLEVFA
mmetsp:Transcript_6715/g.12414  ORF Transcript_6715/g.12414 Transcript_6715/m.12414 type:complete len:101 (-) Transcript_6715:250-552(-)